MVGGSNAIGTVARTALAGTGDQRVFCDFGCPVRMPAYAEVAPASKTAAFTIQTSAVSSQCVVNITALLNGNISNSRWVSP